MKKAIADIWVKALRSGEYKQTTGELRGGLNTDSFCCLGVLCNLHAQTHPKFAAKQDDPGFYGGQSDVPPEIVMNWSGLKTELGEFGSEMSLAEMNDEGADFNKIADTIEKNWRKL